MKLFAAVVADPPILLPGNWKTEDEPRREGEALVVFLIRDVGARTLGTRGHIVTLGLSDAAICGIDRSNLFKNGHRGLNIFLQNLELYASYCVGVEPVCLYDIFIGQKAFDPVRLQTSAYNMGFEGVVECRDGDQHTWTAV